METCHFVCLLFFSAARFDEGLWCSGVIILGCRFQMLWQIKKQALFTLLIVAVWFVPSWAILPEKPSTAVRSLAEGGLAILPAAGGDVEVAAAPSGGGGYKAVRAAQAARAWQKFVEKTGRGWSVRWDGAKGTPSFVAGRAIALPGAKKLTADNIESECLAFVADNAELLGVQPGQLRRAGNPVFSRSAGGRWYISWQQMHDSVPVLGGRVRMSFDREDRLVMFGSDILPDVAVEAEPGISRKDAVYTASADCKASAGADRVGDTQLCILPLRKPDGFSYLLCWRLYISQPALHKKWQYFVDAHTGRIVSKANALIYQNATGTVRGEYKPEFGVDASMITPFPNENVTIHGPEIVIASWDLDTDPLWSTEGNWQFGKPAGGGGSCGDPDSGYTGENIYGYNLNGSYTDYMPAYHLTTTPIDCSGYENVHLKFARWLAVESAWYDKARVLVSSDGNNWTRVWTNPVGSLCDGEWVSVTYDISSVADGQPTVYVRWAMGPTDMSVVYGGWNIDDVKLVSYAGGIETVQTQPDGYFSLPLPWEPSTIVSDLSGPYCRINYGCRLSAHFEQTEVRPLDAVDFTWDAALYNEVVEPSVYLHANYVHDYFAVMDPCLGSASANYPSGLDYPMPVHVQAGCPQGYCNAYWDGEAMAFGMGDGWYCDDFGLYAEVVYHEYTHATTSIIYDDIYLPYFAEPGALNEAWSDYFGYLLSPSRSPLVGDGGLILFAPEGFRSLDNTYRRETDFVNEVHFDCQTVSGALYEARALIKPPADAELFDQLVHFARYAHPQAFEEYVLALLVEDDARFGDSFLGNGTPHCEAIYTGFGNHGIGGLRYLAPSIVVDDSAGDKDGRLEPGETVKLSLSLINGWADAVRVRARLASSDPYVTIIRPEAGFADAAHGEITDNAADPFVVSLSPACPGTHTINFTLEVTAGGPYPYSRTCLFTYAVAAGQLVYDDGQVDDLYLGFGAPGGVLAVRVTPDRYPCYPVRVRLYPYPEDGVSVTLKLWADDGPNSLPGTVLGSLRVTVTPTGAWYDVDISSLGLRIDGGSFYVGWTEGNKTYYNGLDMDPPYHRRSWVYFPSGPDSGEWFVFDDAGLVANLMVRVRCLYEGENGPVENLTGGGKYDRIQTAINHSEPGDRIMVGQGLYSENIDFWGKNVSVGSREPQDSAVVADTIIAGDSPKPVVSFCAGEGGGSVLRGLTIKSRDKTDAGQGGILCRGQGTSGPAIENCVIVQNAGPGIFCDDSSPTITGCTISDNRADGLKLRAGSYPKIANCIITANLRNGISGGYPTVANCTIAGNSQSGIFNSRPVMTNSIVWGNLDSQIKGQASATYSNIKGGWPGLGNIDADPCFADAGAGDYHLKSAGWRWDPAAGQWTWDTATSRCIDAGNPGSALGAEPLTLDVDPLNRFGRNFRIDMGAYGGTSQASMPPHGWVLLADLNNDGIVDFKDLAHWAAYWPGAGFELPADLDRNALVDMRDLARLAQDWLRQTSWRY